MNQIPDKTNYHATKSYHSQAKSHIHPNLQKIVTLFSNIFFV